MKIFLVTVYIGLHGARKNSWRPTTLHFNSIQTVFQSVHFTRNWHDHNNNKQVPSMNTYITYVVLYNKMHFKPAVYVSRNLVTSEITVKTASINTENIIESMLTAGMHASNLLLPINVKTPNNLMLFFSCQFLTSSIEFQITEFLVQRCFQASFFTFPPFSHISEPIRLSDHIYYRSIPQNSIHYLAKWIQENWILQAILFSAFICPVSLK